jgi:hypothetical protein
MLKKLPIKDSSDAQLRQFGEEVLGLNFKLNASRTDLLAAINQADPNIETIIAEVPDEPAASSENDFINQEDEAPTFADRARAAGAAAGVTQMPPPANGDELKWTPPPAIFDGVKLRMGHGPAYKSDPLVVLMMQKTEDAGGERPVPIGCNGVVIQVPRGVLVALPFRYFLALQHTVRTLITQDKDMNFQSRDVPNYPHSIKWLPPRSEMKAWLNRDATRGSPKDRQPAAKAA